MKERFEKYFSQQSIGFAFLVFGGILFYFILSRIEDVLSWIGWVLAVFKPFLWGLIIAYFVNFFMVFFERRVFKKIKNGKTQRSAAMICGFLLALIIVILCIAIIVPQTADSIAGLIGNTAGYIENFTAFATTFAANHVWATNILDWATVKLVGLEDSLPSFFTEYVLPYTVDITTKITSIIVNLFIAIVVSIYFLARKERFYAQTKKVLYAHMKKEKVERLLQLTSLSNETFSSFISGKLLDSLIIGILAFICLSIFHFPYALLVAVIIGITNIIPFFGPIIGAVPCFFIILIVDPAKALWFLLFILILQQVDGNIIGPKILGYSIGLSAIWIVFAIVIGNQLFGFIGMVIGVPLFAIIYVLFKEWSENKLRQKQMPTKTEEYASEKNQIRY
jgi:predicted PurR-regulated permease PerM